MAKVQYDPICTYAVISHLDRFVSVGFQRYFITRIGPGTQNDTEIHQAKSKGAAAVLNVE